MIDPKLYPFIDQVIRANVGKRVRSYGIPASEFDDAAGELWVHVIANIGRHDPAKGPIEALINVVVSTKATSIVRRLRAEKRRATTGPIGGIDVTRDMRRPAPTDFAKTMALQMDVAAAIASLPPPLQSLCRELMVKAVKPIAESRGVPRTTLRRDVARIREHFERCGLGDYGARAATFSPDRVVQGRRSTMRAHRSERGYVFKFGDGVDLNRVRALAAHSSSIASLMHGEAAVKVGGEIEVSEETGCATVAATGRVGEDLALLLSSFVTAEFGGKSYVVESA